MKLSIVIPARNEREVIGHCLDRVVSALSTSRRIPFEIVVVDDNSTDDTAAIVLDKARRNPRIRLVRRDPPAGFGRALRSGLQAAEGDAVVVFMADLSDDPDDILSYYGKLEEGYDCVFGSRFVEGSAVRNYPPGKLLLNRIVNRAIRWMFWTDLNDLTNAFKAYRRRVLNELGPPRANYFDLSVELSLGALVGGYSIAQIPITWNGRQEGQSKLNLLAMGPPFGRTLLRMWRRRLAVSGRSGTRPSSSTSGRRPRGHHPIRHRLVRCPPRGATEDGLLTKGRREASHSTRLPGGPDRASPEG